MQYPDISDLLATSDAAAIREGMALLLAAQGHGSEGIVFQARADALMGAVVPALVWLRDHKGLSLTLEMLRSALKLETLFILATRHVFRPQPYEAGAHVDIAVDDMPDSIILPIRQYVDELPGVGSWSNPDHIIGEACRMHLYAQMYFIRIFSELLPAEDALP